MATSYCEVKPCRIPVPVIEREATTLPTPCRHLGQACLAFLILFYVHRDHIHLSQGPLPEVKL